MGINDVILAGPAFQFGRDINKVFNHIDFRIYLHRIKAIAPKTDLAGFKAHIK